MDNIKVRRYIVGDESEICNLIKKDLLTENIKDYSKEYIDNLIKSNNKDLIIKRAKQFHVYVLINNKKIVGVGMIGPYWGSLTESSFFTIFIDPEYKGYGLGRKIIETLEKDEYYKRANRVEIPASITAVEFYKHFGYGFKKFGNIVDKEGMYRMEKYPRKSNDNTNATKYNMRPYIDNKYHNYKEFIYQLIKVLYKKYIDCWDEEKLRNKFEDYINRVNNDLWIIQLNGKDIGFYNGVQLDGMKYEIENICLDSKYQRKGIGTEVLNDIIELHKNEDILVRVLKQNVVVNLYKRFNFAVFEENELYYQMIKLK